MTRKHKPAAASRKRASADRKPVKTANHSHKKSASAGDKHRRPQVPARKTAELKPKAALHAKPPESHKGASTPHAPKNVSNDVRTAGTKSADKKPLGIERRAAAMPEDRQSQLKLLIARGKEQGYLTYAQVNDHLPSEIVDPEQIEDIVN